MFQGLGLFKGLHLFQSLEYANFSDFFTSGYAIFDFVKKKSRYANFSASHLPQAMPL